MRNHLDESNRKMHYISGCENGLFYGLCSTQGWRKSMEDAHCVEVNFPGDWKEWNFFAIFDGHGGKEVSTLCAKHLFNIIMKTKQFQSSIIDSRNGLEFTNKAQQGIKEAFLNLDFKIRRSGMLYKKLYCGSTVISVFISPTHFYIANLGDSRAVISHDKDIRLITTDHKPDKDCEKQRIERAGGHIYPNHSSRIPRINGLLSVSRAIGDYAFKRMWCKRPFEQLVSPEPDVLVLDRHSADEFLVLACDGIWDVLESEELCNYIRFMLHNSDNLEFICKSIIDICFYKGSRDNMSILIILLPGAPKKSAQIIQQTNLFYSVLKKRIKDMLSIFGNMKPPKLTKKLSSDNEILQNPFFGRSPFRESFCFLYPVVRGALLNL